MIMVADADRWMSNACAPLAKLAGVLPFGDRYDDPVEPTMGQFFGNELTSHSWHDIMTKLEELSL
jgi:hypothetical protein